MNVDEVLDTVEQNLLSRELSSLERFILCHSWLGRGYSQMASDCAYSIAHIKDIGSQLWQALSKALRERVTKKNLFLVLKQYLLSQISETVNSDLLSVTFSLVEVIDPPLTPTTNQLPVTTEVEVIDPPLTPTTNQLPVTTDFVEAVYSEDSEQLPLVCDRPTALRASYGRRCPSLRDAFSPSAATAEQTRKGDHGELVTEESSLRERVQQEYQTSADNTEAENNLKAPVTQSKPTIPSDCLPLDSPLYIYINRLKCLIRIKAPRLLEKSSLLSYEKKLLAYCIFD